MATALPRSADSGSSGNCLFGRIHSGLFTFWLRAVALAGGDGGRWILPVPQSSPWVSRQYWRPAQGRLGDGGKHGQLGETEHVSVGRRRTVGLMDASSSKGNTGLCSAVAMVWGERGNEGMSGKEGGLDGRLKGRRREKRWGEFLVNGVLES